MANFDRETEYLFAIIKSAINNTTLETNNEVDWDKLLEFAEKQDLFGLIADTVDKNTLPENARRKLHNFEKSQLVHMIAMNNELKIIENELKTLGVKFMLLKGSRIREFYPKQIMRQMADVDIMYDIKDQQKLIQLMQNKGYKLTSDGGNSDDFTKPPFYTFEFHHDLFKDVYGFCPDFSFVWQRAKVDDQNECKYVMTIEDLYLHSLAHMYKHFVFGGFGLRFIIDNYLILKQFSDNFDEEYISFRIEEMQLQKFRNIIDELSVSFFEGEFSKSQVAFINERLLAGVYGSHIENIDEIYSRFQNQNEKHSVVRFVLQRIFPSKVQMVSKYPVLKDKPYLLPLYYIIRIFTKSKKGFKKVQNEVKSINKIEDK